MTVHKHRTLLTSALCAFVRASVNSGVTVVVVRGQPLGRTLSHRDWLTGTPGPPKSSAATGGLSLRLIWRKMDVCRARQQLRCERECGCVRVSKRATGVQSESALFNLALSQANACQACI